MLDITGGEVKTTVGPMVIVKEALGGCASFFINTLGNPCDQIDGLERQDFFKQRVYGVAYADPNTDGDEEVARIGNPPEGDDSLGAAFDLIQTMNVIVAYSVQSIKAEREGQRDASWQYACKANYWLAVLRATTVEAKFRENPAVALAKLSHAEHLALEKEALAYWKQHISPNMSAQKAADILVGQIPFSHKKLAKIVSTERNRLGISSKRKARK